jgi:hypothetical protein
VRTQHDLRESAGMALDLEYQHRAAGAKHGCFHVARAVLGMANRMPERAARTSEGLGYLVVGAEPGNPEGVSSIAPQVRAVLYRPGPYPLTRTHLRHRARQSIRLATSWAAGPAASRDPVIAFA